MQGWLAASGIQEGALFRRLRKGGHPGEPIATAAVRDIVKERCALAGMEGKYAEHSLRAGFVTEPSVVVGQNGKMSFPVIRASVQALSKTP